MPTIATEDGSTADMSIALGGAGRRRRALAIAVVALSTSAIVAVFPSSGASNPVERPPNVLLVITDDQPWDTLPTVEGPPAMPWLETRLEDGADHWVRFTNAFLNVPLCCPSRASILTGRYAVHTGVERNADGYDLDESSTLATWLDDAGYRTAFIGKYLNGYPWDRGPYVPIGWDRFLAKRNPDVSTTYEGYPFIDQGVPLSAGTSRASYATSLLSREASSFLRGVPTDTPWFLVFAPSAPHEPWAPAPVDAGRFSDVSFSTTTGRLNDVRGKPDWVRSLPRIDASAAAALDEQRRRMLETLGAVDRAIRSLVYDIQVQGTLDRTLIIVLSDNGYSFGDHRWVGKRCPYDACARTSLVMRSPWTTAGTVSTPVSNVDLAPTILDVIGEPGPEEAFDGVSLRPELDDRVLGSLARDAVLIEWAGDDEVPAWRGVRTATFSYVEHSDGSVELYDIGGRRGTPDPFELWNHADDPAYGSIRRKLAGALAQLVSERPPADFP